jgi:hypothetical protein
LKDAGGENNHVPQPAGQSIPAYPQTGQAFGINLLPDLDKGNIKATSIKDITKATTPFDFEGKISRWCYWIRK